REGVVGLGQRLRGAAGLVRELIGEIGGALALLRIGCRGLGVLLQRDQVLLDGVGAVGEGGGGLGEGGGPLGDAGGGALQLLEIGDERIGGAGHPLRGVADVGRAVGRGGGGLIGGGRVGRGLGGLAAQRLRTLGHLRETGAELLVRAGVRAVRGELVDLVGVAAHAL